MHIRTAQLRGISGWTRATWPSIATATCDWGYRYYGSFQAAALLVHVFQQGQSGWGVYRNLYSAAATNYPDLGAPRHCWTATEEWAGTEDLHRSTNTSVTVGQDRERNNSCGSRKTFNSSSSSRALIKFKMVALAIHIHVIIGEQSCLTTSPGHT